MVYTAIILCLMLSAFFSISEISFVSADRLQVELDKAEGSKISKIQALFYRNSGKFITSNLISNNIVNVMYGLFIAMVLEEPLLMLLRNEFVVVLVQTLISTALVIIFGEYIPKSIGQMMPNATLKVLSIPLFVVYVLLYPITLLVSWITSLVFWLFGVKNKEDTIQPLSKTDLDYYIESNVPQEEKASEAKILQNALDFADTKVRDCLVPRNEITAVEHTATLEELIELFDKTGYSKIMVYNDTIDDIIGYIHGIEMYKVAEHGESWQQYLRDPLYVPESLPVKSVMKQLLTKKRNIAVVVDELGGTAGIVTLEDVVEEIFGDIEDEHDTKRIVMRQVDEGEFILSGRAEIDTINDTFGLDIPNNDDYKTIAGFILFHYQGIPERGEEFTIAPHFHIRVMRATNNKITLIRLKDTSI